MKETRKRSVVKAISWRIIATSTTVVLVLIFTGNFVLAAGVGVFDMITKLLFYYVHERAWNKLKWGKQN